MSLVRSIFSDPFFDALSSRGLDDPFFRDPMAMMRSPMRMGMDTWQPRLDLTELSHAPRVDVWDAGDSIRVHAELPGVPKEKVRAEIVNGNLSIEGETEDIKNYENMTSRVRERRYGRFSRVIGLPAGVDAGNVKAEFKNGILEMTVPKTQESQTKRIEIA